MTERQTAGAGSAERIRAGNRSSPLWLASLALAALAFTACLITVLVARLMPDGGHPPLSFYVGAFAIPLAWLFSLLGIALAIASRRSVPVPRYRLALGGNLLIIVLGGLIWVFWPWFAS